MAAYVVVDIEITDPAAFQRYVSVAGPIMAKYGGRVVAAGPPVATLEGSWHPKGVTLIEFPSVEHARRWHGAPEYQAPLQLRQSAAKSRMVLLDALPPA
jgi:uncharacterized protein (DUF1330 family)